LSGVEVQAEKYSTGLPENVDPLFDRLPFVYLSTGTETTFTNLLDHEPRSRLIFSFHRAETLAEWRKELIRLVVEKVGLNPEEILYKAPRSVMNGVVAGAGFEPATFGL
jgi:type I site-specific restriction endonuclease